MDLGSHWKQVLFIASSLALSGCFAAAAGVHQQMTFESEVPDVQVKMLDQTCDVPCSMKIRRQWGTFNLEATQAGQTIAKGPIYRREEYGDVDKCKDEMSGLSLAAFIDGLLIIPGIIDLSTGIIVWHPEKVTIRQGSFTLDDPCFRKPVVVGGP